ncbi:hypothetical protein CUC08_Gglean012086 [Alternaria sp. MG1]|nr:hypothetical protein CUC08_Gglean012086 [Alternaria sp. MG1]
MYRTVWYCKNKTSALSSATSRYSSTSPYPVDGRALMDIVSRLSTHTHRFDALTSIQVLLDSALDLALIHRLNILALRLLVSSHSILRELMLHHLPSTVFHSHMPETCSCCP